MTDNIHTPHRLTKHVRFVQKTTLVFDGKVLILKRSPKEESRPNCWDLPGGHTEWPHDVKSNQRDLHQRDAVREVAEETGVKIAQSEIDSANLAFFETYFEPNEKTYKIYCGWRVKLPSDFNVKSIKLSDEHTGFAWVNVSELDKYDFGGPAGQFIVKQIKNSLKKHE